MADRQRIHPVVADVEAPAPQTAPLVPPGSFRSDKGHPPPPLPPLNTNNHRPPPIVPPLRNDKSSRSCLLRCMCWTISLLVILLILVGALVGIIFLAFKPQVPKYSVDSLRIGDLRLNLDMTLYARFDVKITATNPNKKIGIYYEKGSKLSVWYTKTKLCQGSLPVFYQGHQNTTKLNVALTGQTQAGSTLMSALQEQQQTGRIPLDLKVDVPAAIKLGKLKLPKVRFLVGCQLIVDSLSSNSLVSIKASNCRFKQLKL
uniref:Late embryogenesis abundant protein LEA-2 subgroup domain-containing protein n=1 Tax=Kalanchoe fedtschenkoi TaxID=63787 RepID=A0A7N0U5H5_KALFE